MSDSNNRIVDNRHKKERNTDDYVIAEIQFYLATYRKRETKFERLRKWNETISLILLFIIIVTSCVIYSPFLFGDDLIGNWNIRLEVTCLLVISLSLFLVNYFWSRLKGFTRAWSRNRLMRERIEIIEREYVLSNYEENALDDESIKAEQENTLVKLFDLEVENRIATQRDIVGDYIAANEGTFNWIKGFRK
ncbi:hypothetical protein [Pseudoalteromonas piratica]|uniref:SMODS and SLOG-associating 2TM effector domain-containing protein n=1 Tax=Pseudoalteromonas piratica TaxID=1348114 RepID=A0A0A7EGW1_9GAMM|nr:hypothetical protein [Pseudoalteromonas piratica]AIY65864.1 hypothetical protein OM33_12555 [Pseudoalteromonas piratica]